MAPPWTARAFAVISVASLAGCGRIGYEYQDGSRDGGASNDATAINDGGNVPDGVGTADLVAWYPLDDDPNDGVRDATGHGHDGSCSSCPATITGQIGGGYDFNTGPMIDVPNAAAFDPTASFSASIWFRLDATVLTSTACMLGKQYGVDDQNSWQLCVRTDDKPYACLSDGTSNQCYVAGPRITIDEWHHYAMTYDGGTLKVYIDAVRLQEADIPIFADDGALNIGGDRNAGVVGALFDGSLDDARIWNRALTQAELSALITP